MLYYLLFLMRSAIDICEALVWNRPNLIFIHSPKTNLYAANPINFKSWQPTLLYIFRSSSLLNYLDTNLRKYSDIRCNYKLWLGLHIQPSKFTLALSNCRGKLRFFIVCLGKKMLRQFHLLYLEIQTTASVRFFA